MHATAATAWPGPTYAPPPAPRGERAANRTALASDRPMDVIDAEDVVDVLNDLLESARDGEYGFHACAEHAESGQLKGIFQRHSRECAAAAVELEHEIRRLNGDPAQGGPWRARCTGAGCR